MARKYVFVGWVMALFATSASVYFIEILGNPAAFLCWFERMLMFGLLLVLTVGIITKDKNVGKYTIPFLFFGIPSALYQQLVHWGIINLPVQPCGVGFACSTKFFELFGFITQATLCLTAFFVIGFCMYKARLTKANTPESANE